MRSLLLATFLLAACTAAPVVTPAVQGDVLPVEAQRVIDRATATAGAVATQVAQATARDVAARATSTVAAQLTHDALAVEQTRAALSLTQEAGQALATDAAAKRTQTVQETQEARQGALRATHAAQTPTWAAVSTQSAQAATQAAERQGRAASAGEFWRWLRLTTVVAVAALAATFCVVVLVRGLAYVVVEYQREQANTARSAFRILPPGHWAEWQPGDGYRVYQLPGALDSPPVIIENAPTAPSHIHAWRHAVRLFCWWGDRYGFGIRDLGASGAGVVSDPDWRQLVKLLKEAGVLAEVTQPGKRGRVTAWAPEWDYRRLTDELSTGKLALPFPAGQAAPKVAFAVPTQHHSATQHERTTQVQT